MWYIILFLLGLVKSDSDSFFKLTLRQMAIRNKRFSRGYRFRDFEGQPQEELIEMGIPERVVIPLSNFSLVFVNFFLLPRVCMMV